MIENLNDALKNLRSQNAVCTVNVKVLEDALELKAEELGLNDASSVR